MDEPSAVLEFTAIAASPAPLPQRAEALLEVLGRVIPFDGAWLALADPPSNSYTTAASTDLGRTTLRYLTGPAMAGDIETTGTNRAIPPLSPSDLPFPAAELPTWAECLIPAGIHEALAVSLFVPGRRRVGFLALLSAARTPPPESARRLLARVTPVLAGGIDPLRSLVSAARLVHGATAGVLLRVDGATEAVPGLTECALLAPGSQVLTAARDALGDRGLLASFLWPLGGRHEPQGHVRVTALGGTAEAPARVTGMVLLSPPGDLRGLTPRELEVLGLMVAGSSNAEIARALVVTQRTVAARVEHVLAKLGAASRTLAAVRAEREGLYVPHRAAAVPTPRPPTGSHPVDVRG